MEQPPGDGFVWPAVNHVAPGAATRWLTAGRADLAADPLGSLFYGVDLAIRESGVTRKVGGAVRLAPTTGFLPVGPCLALGRYEPSRPRAAGEASRLAPSLIAWRANFPAIRFYAGALTLLLAVWLRVSVVGVALFFPEGRVDWSSPAARVFFGAHAKAGSGLALPGFATTGLSLLLRLERRDMAAIVSCKALRTNFATMIRWGACIATLTLAGIATFYLARVVVLPLIGQMSWHACRETVNPLPQNQLSKALERCDIRIHLSLPRPHHACRPGRIGIVASRAGSAARPATTAEQSLIQPHCSGCGPWADLRTSPVWGTCGD